MPLNIYLIALALLFCPFFHCQAATLKKIVLIAGPLDDHPVNTHEYSKNVQLLKDCLDHAPNLSGLQTEVYLGWPTNAAALDDADTIFLTSGGSDRNETDHPLYVGDHFAQLEKQMNRGCGLVLFHWSTFHPARVQDKIFDWVGGYFDYETGTNGPTRKWFSKIENHDWLVTPAAKDHPINRGINPFQLPEEFYFNLRFREHDSRVTPILLKDTKGNEPENIVGWATERANGGRSFGFTGGHNYTNWFLYDFRKLVLNAIVWTAKMDVPAEGVNSKISKNILALTSVKSPAKPKPAKKVLPPMVQKDSGATAHEDAWVDGRWNQTDLGQTLACNIDLTNGPVAKALNIRIGDYNEAAVCYDTATMNLRVAWTGSFLQFDPARYGIISHPKIAGEIQRMGSNWTNGPVQYHGMFLDGSRVVLSYNAAGQEILESPWYENGVFTRTFEFAPSEKGFNMVLDEGIYDRSDANSSFNKPVVLFFMQNGKPRGTSVIGDGSVIVNSSGSTCAQLMAFAHKETLRCKILYSSSSISKEQFLAAVKQSAPPEDLKKHSKSSKQRWASISVKGELSLDPDPYVVDTIPVPYDNPAHALMFFTGLDFFANGDAALCTLHGDVWIVSGIDDTLQNIKWRRYATGLFQPLGLKIVKDTVYVLGRDQITAFHDADKNDEARFYENYYNNIHTSVGGHDFVSCLETDAKGNFYYVDPDGLHRLAPAASLSQRHAVTVAAGWRNPNGMAINRDGAIVIAPQEGEWTPSSEICEVKSDGWYGYGGPRVTPDRPQGYDAPLCWLPRVLDNSTGGQTWAASDKWGPYKDQLLSFSFGRCSMMMVLRDIVDETPQGAVIPLKPHFLSGAMRGRFRSQDGQLYVVGTLGWSTSATKDGSFQRVRYTGKKVYSPISYHVFQNGIELGFTQSLDKETAEDPGSYGIEQWNYLYASTYGSKEYSVANPPTVGHDPVEIQSAKLQPDGHTVFLAIAGIQPVMQMEIKYNLNAADGKAVRGEIYNTINRVPQNAHP